MFVLWVCRMYILEYYRGFEIFQIDEFRRYYAWVEVVKNYFSVKVVLQDKDRVLVNVKLYVEGNVKFEFVDVVYKGIIIFQGLYVQWILQVNVFFYQFFERFYKKIFSRQLFYI